MLFMFMTCRAVVAYRRDPLLRRPTSGTLLEAFNPSRVAAGQHNRSKRQHSLVLLK